MHSHIRCVALIAAFFATPAMSAGSIQGTIINDFGGQGTPVAVGAGDAGVRVYDAAGVFVEEALTDASGMYQTSPLPDGTYYLHSINVVGLIDERYDNIDCGPCVQRVTDGTPLDVTSANQTGIDFTLTPGSRISGRVMDAVTSDPISSVRVCIPQDFGTLAGVCGTTDSNGDYQTDAGVPPGNNYFALIDPADANLGFYVPEIYDGVAFADNVFSGTPIDLSTMSQPGIDFQLEEGGKLQVNVTAADTGSAITDFTIAVLDENGFPFRNFSAPSGNGGTFITPVLPAGRRSVSVITFDNVHVGQFLNGPACAVGLCFSPLGFAAPTITVNAGTTDTHDVALELGYTISGTVLDDVGTPVPSPEVCVHFDNGVFAGACTGSQSQSAKGTGAYTTDLLPAGNDYRVLAQPPTDGQVAEIWPDVQVPPVLFTLAARFSEEFLSADPVAVGPDAGGNATGIDFTLDTAGRIVSSSVTDEFDNSLVNSVDVTAYDAQNRLVNFGSGSSGSFVVGSLPTGDYRLILSGLDDFGGEYVPEIFQDIFCPNFQCAFLGTLDTGDLISVTAGADTSIMAQLTLAGVAEGFVLDDQGAGVESTPVDFYDMSGNFFARFFTQQGGFYEAFLPEGDYFVATGAARLGFIDQIYNSGGNVSCPLNDCESNVMSGTTVFVPRGDGITGIDFSLNPGGKITGAVVEADSGQPAVGIKVRIFDGLGNPAPAVTTDTGGIFRSLPLPDGTYKLFADGEARGFTSEIYDDMPCLPGVCESGVVSQGTGVSIAGAADTMINNIVLQAGGALTVSDLEAQDGLGASVAICGPRVAIGVPGDDDAGDNAGAVLVYRREGSGYELDHKILPQVGTSGNPVAGEMFGSSVSCSGDLIVIGAPGSGIAGKGMGTDKAAYVMQMTAGSSSSLGKLIAANLGLADDAGFGSAVSMDGMTVAIGAPNAMNDSGMASGAAMMFDFDDPDPQSSVVTISDDEANAGAGFGSSLSVNGGKVAIGAPAQNNPNAGNAPTGLAQLFNNLSGTNNWNNVGKFGNPNSDPADNNAAFGAAVSLQSGMMAVGSPGEGSDDAGAALVFEFDEGGNFTQVGDAIAPDDPVAGGHFGSSVSLTGNSVVVGSPGAENGSGAKTGAAYLLTLSGGIWGQVQKALAASGAGGDGFGSAIAFDGDNFVVGAPNGSSSVADAGYAQAFTNADRLFQGGFE